MYLKIKNQKIEIIECSKFIDRFKSLKFVLEKIDYGLKFPNKKRINTTFFCQRVDLCFTDKDSNIIALYENVKSEKKFHKRKAQDCYILPLNTAKQLKLNDKLNIKEK